jgi:hypothetical protein
MTKGEGLLQNDINEGLRMTELQPAYFTVDLDKLLYGAVVSPLDISGKVAGWQFT